MSDDDVMISISISVRRDGAVRVNVIKPNGAINAEGVMILGALQVAREHIKFASTEIPNQKKKEGRR